MREVAEVLAHLPRAGRAVQTEHVGSQRAQRGEGGADLGAEQHEAGGLDGDLQLDRHVAIGRLHGAMRAAFSPSSWARSARPYSVRTVAKAPNVLVSTTSTPTAKKESCRSAMTSGRVSLRISGQPSYCGPP